VIYVYIFQSHFKKKPAEVANSAELLAEAVLKEYDIYQAESPPDLRLNLQNTHCSSNDIWHAF
jgi:hypothetical protein